MEAPPTTRFVVTEKNLVGFRGLTFDAFGALFADGPMQLPGAVVRALSEVHPAPDRASLQSLWRNTLRQQLGTGRFISFREAHRRTFHDLFERFGLTRDEDECIDEAFEGYRASKLYPEVPAVLRELEQQVPLAVVSNMETAVLLDALQRNGLAFSFVITSEEEQRYKPAESLFRRAIRYLGLPPAHILHVGDSYVEDVVGATSAGMGSLLIRRPGAPEDPQGEARKVVHDFREVRDFLRGSWELGAATRA